MQVYHHNGISYVSVYVKCIGSRSERCIGKSQARNLVIILRRVNICSRCVMTENVRCYKSLQEYTCASKSHMYNVVLNSFYEHF